MKQIVERIPLYLQYFLYKSDEHSLQAPFAFEFYKNVILKSKSDPADQEVEAQRFALSESEKIITYQTFGKTSALNSQKRKKVSQIVKRGISTQKKSKLFSAIIQKFQCRRIVELGTSVGINTVYLSRANTNGKILTVEGHPELSEIATSVFRELRIENIELVCGNIDEKINFIAEYFENIDFLFIDANHKSEAVIGYYESLKSKFAKDTIVILDDIRWSKDMYHGWKELIQLETVSHSFDLGDFGILFHKIAERKQHYTLDF